MTGYKVISMTPTFITDKTNIPKKAFTVTFDLTDYDERHSIDVESDDPDIIQQKIEAFVERRDKLAQLGG